MGTTDGRERRRWPRFEVGDHSVVVYRIGGLLGVLFRKKNIGRTVRDLSKGGARFLLEDRVKIGASVRMMLILDKFQDVIEAEGRVCWVTEMKGRHGQFEAGVEFTKMDPVHERKLETLRGWFTSDAYRIQKDTQVRRRARQGGVEFPG